MLELSFIDPTDYLIKIDPDTRAYRRLNYAPMDTCIFGSIQGPRTARFIQGGFLGLIRNAASRMAESGLLEDSRLKNPLAGPQGDGHWLRMARRAARVGLISFDWILGWAATQLQIPIRDFSEVKCTWKTPIDNPDLRYAFTHPVQKWSHHESIFHAPPGH